MVPDQGSVVPPATIGTPAETTSVDTGQVIGNGQVIVNPQVNQHPVVSDQIVSDQVIGEQVIGDPGQSSVPAEASSQQTRIEPTPVETSDSTLDSQPKTFEEPKELIGVSADKACLLYTSPSPRDQRGSRMPSSA